MRSVCFVLLVACSTSTDKPASTDTASEGSTGSTTDPSGHTGTPRDCVEPDPDPPATREGHASDGWNWQKHGPLFEDAETLSYTDGDLAPSVVDTGSELVLLFSRKRGTEHTLLVSSSTDGASWSTP